MGCSPALHFLLGHKENKRKPSFAFFVSWRRVGGWSGCHCGAFGARGGGGMPSC